MLLTLNAKQFEFYIVMKYYSKYVSHDLIGGKLKNMGMKCIQISPNIVLKLMESN